MEPAHVDGSLEPQRGCERDGHGHQEVAGQPVFLLPPVDVGRRHGFPVVGEVVGDQAELRLQVGILENVAPLASVCAGRVLHQQPDVARAGLLEVHAVRRVVDG